MSAQATANIMTILEYAYLIGWRWVKAHIIKVNRSYYEFPV